MGCTAGPSGVRRPPWEVLPSRRPIVQRPRADCEDDPEPGTRTSRKKGLAQGAAIRRPLVPAECVVHLGMSYPPEDPSCSGPVPTAKTTLNPAHVRPERRALHKEPRLDDTIRPLQQLLLTAAIQGDVLEGLGFGDDGADRDDEDI